MNCYYEKEPNDANRWTEAADKGNGQFAIAVALLEVANAIRAASNVDAIALLSTNLGEKLDFSLSSIATSLQSIAQDYTPTDEGKANGQEDRR